MSGILGLTSGKTFNDNGFHSLNDRRQVFHNFPNGGAPLTGLLSLVEDEPTDNPHFGWFEKRYQGIKTTVLGGQVPLTITGTANTAGAAPDLVTGTIYRVRVTDASCFKVSHNIWIKDVPVTGGIGDIYGTITEMVNATTFEFRVNSDQENVINTDNPDTGLVGRDVFCLGTANAEGALSTNGGRLIAPSNPSNFTQIFREPIYFTATSLKIPTAFDKTGLYREKSKDAAIDHMTGMEKAFLFGRKSLQYVPHAVTGELVPQRTTGGIMHFLQEYEKENGGEFNYRPNSNALTSNDDDDKRIIRVAGNGILAYSVWCDFIERVFRKTNNKAFEKLVLCGNGVLQAVNKLIELNLVQSRKEMMANDTTYNMNVTSIETVFGVLHFKTHPLFTEDPTLRNSALITDIGELKYRCLNDRDTTLIPNRQQNDEDGRKDEWLTEAGLEVHYPESHMMIHNLKGFTL